MASGIRISGVAITLPLMVQWYAWVHRRPFWPLLHVIQSWMINTLRQLSAFCLRGQPTAPNKQNLKLLQKKHSHDPWPEALEDIHYPASTEAWQASVGGGIGDGPILLGWFSRGLWWLQTWAPAEPGWS